MCHLRRVYENPLDMDMQRMYSAEGELYRRNHPPSISVDLKSYNVLVACREPILLAVSLNAGSDNRG
jgi:hypothetical protein